MGKKGGATSWLTAVKRALRSPTKDADNKSNRRRKVEHDQQEEEEKKKGRRRWLFRKPPNNAQINTANGVLPKSPVLPAEQRHAIAVAAATAAAAEAAVATAKAAVEMFRLSQPSKSNSSKQNSAAILIQTAFRGYLARRALVALKGIVRLQALIRGQNVRRQAKMTLKCMQALLRVQSRVQDQRSRLSQDGGRRMSMFAETTNLWESKYLKDVRDRRNSTSRYGSCVSDDWRDCPRTLEELEAILQARNEAASKHGRSLAYALSQQVCDNDSKQQCAGDEEDVEDRANWLEKWMATKQWDTSSRASTDYKRDSIKTVEIDSLNLNLSSYSTLTARKSQYQSPNHRQAIPSSPHSRSLHNIPITHPPITPSPITRTRTMHVRSASPRCLKEEKSFSTANTPNLRCTQRVNNSIYRNNYNTCGNDQGAGIPNYMAATESAKARIRSQSAPRQRLSTPERERGGLSVKKRLSYPVPEPYGYTATGYGFSGFSQNLRSPSFKSVQAGYVGMEKQSCYTESIGGEISPCSTTDLRRWLRC